MSLPRKIVVKRLDRLDRIPKEDKHISPILRGHQGSLSNATKPNVTQSAGNPQDLRPILNFKRREAVKRQQAETADPLTESKLTLTKTTPTVTGLDATPTWWLLLLAKKRISGLCLTLRSEWEKLTPSSRKYAQHPSLNRAKPSLFQVILVRKQHHPHRRLVAKGPPAKSNWSFQILQTNYFW